MPEPTDPSGVDEGRGSKGFPGRPQELWLQTRSGEVDAFDDTNIAVLRV